MTAILEAIGITKQFSNGDEVTPVLRGVDLSIATSETVALIGPSGSGKSTLMSIVGLLLSPTSGEIRLAGNQATGLSEAAMSRLRNARLGFVFQAHHLLPDLTARENVALPASAVAGRLTSAMTARADELLLRLGLERRLDFRASRLSGGQKQRVAIARALMNRPDLIIADEPTGALDRENADAVLALIAELNREEGTAFLVSTHDERVAARCTRQVTMVDGLLSQNERA